VSIFCFVKTAEFPTCLAANILPLELEFPKSLEYSSFSKNTSALVIVGILILILVLVIIIVRYDRVYIPYRSL